MKQQDYTIIFVIFLYIFVLRRLNFNISDSGDIVTLLLCFFLVFRSAFRIYSDKNNSDENTIWYSFYFIMQRNLGKGYNVLVVVCAILNINISIIYSS